MRELGFVIIAHFGLLCLLVAASPLAVSATPFIAYGLVNALLAALMHAQYPHARLGICNALTHLRLTLVVLLFTVLTQPEILAGDHLAAWVATGLAMFCLSLDGVDGWMARREGLTSAFGARFDVEVDAALALGLSLLVWQANMAGPWVVVLGLPRYIFVGAQCLWPWLRAALPDRRDRKVVCALQITALIALLCPALPADLSVPLAVVAGAALIASFTRDIGWLWRERVRMT